MGISRIFAPASWDRQRFLGTSGWLALFAPVLLAPSSAFAAADAKSSNEVAFFAAILSLILVGRLIGELMTRLGQPSVMGQLLAGIVLGPSVLGWIWPDLQHWLFQSTKEQAVMLDAISQMGILLLLMLTGMETDLHLVKRVGRAALSISLTGVAVPFLCGIALGWLLPQSMLPQAGQRLLTALFLGTALSISSIKIVAAVVREMGFSRRNLGQTIVASAIIEDTVGWIIIAITLSLAAAGKIDVASVAKSVIGTIIFLVVSFTVGRRAVALLIRWTNDHFESDFPVITTILVIMIAMALTTHFIGVHTVLGAFVAGILIGESPILTSYIDAQLRGLILAFFMPVFFGVAGLNADLSILTQLDLLLMTGVLILVASFGKFTGAFLGAKLGGLGSREALAVGSGMNARGSTEVIVASIGLSMGALSQNLYTMIVAMALTTTMAMPPMLRFSLSRVPLRKAEKQRLEREEAEAKEFIPNLERVLLAIDTSPNGQFASKLAGLLAANRSTPITVLPFDLDAAAKRAEEKPNQKLMLEQAIADSADIARAQSKAKQPDSIEVVVRPISKSEPEEIVGEEAKKGHDLLFIGLHKMRNRYGFEAEVDGIVRSFDGPSAVVLGEGERLEQPTAQLTKILVPIAGTAISRKAAELAFSLGAGSEITALYVGQRRRSKLLGRVTNRHQAKAILEDIEELGARYKRRLTTKIVPSGSPERGIIKEAKAGSYDLIAMGVTRRPGDALFFGDTAAALLDSAPCSLLFLAT